jgi:hypothetical protein
MNKYWNKHSDSVSFFKTLPFGFQILNLKPQPNGTIQYYEIDTSKKYSM